MDHHHQKSLNGQNVKQNKLYKMLQTEMINVKLKLVVALKKFVMEDVVLKEKFPAIHQNTAILIEKLEDKNVLHIKPIVLPVVVVP